MTAAAGTAGHRLSPWLWRSIALLLLVLCAARASTTELDVDNIWLAHISVPHAADQLPLEQGLARRTALDPDCSVEHYRLALRARYTSNYAAYVGVSRLTYGAMAAVEGQSAGTALRALVLTKVLQFILLTGLLLWAATRLQDRRIARAVAAALIVMAALDVALHTGAIPDIAWVDAGYPLKAPKLLAFSFLFASEGHSLFGLTPRNAALVLFALAMVLRWNRQFVGGALAILFAGAFHQTYGGIAVVLFTAAAAVSRPAALKPWAVRIILLLALLLFVGRDLVLQISPALMLAAMIGLSLFAIGGFGLVQSSSYRRLRERWLGRSAEQELLLDAGAIAFICLLVTVAALMGVQHADRPARLFFWSELLVRTWSFARFPLFVAAVWAFLGKRVADHRFVMPAACAAALAIAIVAALQIDRAPAWATAEPLGSGLALAQRPTLDLPADEPLIYGDLLKLSIENGDRTVLAHRLSSLPIRCSD